MTKRKEIIVEETLWQGWEAVFEDYQAGDVIGFGATAEMATADLLEKSEDE